MIRRQFRLSTCRRCKPSESVEETFDVSPTAARLITFDSVWGAPRLRAAAISSLPACAPSPLPARNPPRFPSAAAARPRTCARALCCALAIRRFLFGRGAARAQSPALFVVGALLPFSSPSGFALPAVARAPPRCKHCAPCAYYVSSLTASVVAQAATGKPCGVCTLLLRTSAIRIADVRVLFLKG